MSNPFLKKIGENIDGENEGDLFGFSISFSSDGKKIAIGSPQNDNLGRTNAGCVKIYEDRGIRSSPRWVQIGESILGKNENDQCGYSVSLSSDGSRVLIGCPSFQQSGGVNTAVRPGYLRVFRDAGVNSIPRWVQVGDDITGDEIQAGETMNDGTGFSCEIAYTSGKRIVVGAPLASSSKGRVRVYEELNNSNAWTKVGEDILGENTNDRCGYAVTISNNGMNIGIGSPTSYSGKGSFRSFRDDGTSASPRWVNYGQTLIGETDGDLFGFSLTKMINGEHITIGSPSSDGGRGKIKSFAFSSSKNVWTEIVYDFTSIGVQANQNFGYSISGNSNNAESIIAGSPGFGKFGSSSGSAVVDYKIFFNENLIISTFGENANDRYGFAVGSAYPKTPRFAVGSLNGTSENGNRAGHVKIYELNYFITTATSDQWVKVGQTLLGRNIDDFYGSVVKIPILRENKIFIASSRYQNNRGIVESYKYDGLFWKTFGSTISLIGDAEGDAYGSSFDVSPTGHMIVIGANLGGYVKAYKLNSSTQLFEQWGTTLRDDASGGFFGSSISFDQINSSWVAIGNPEGGTNNEGVVKIYKISESGWGETIYTLTGGEDSAFFGRDVDIQGNNLIVGIPGSLKAKIYTFDTATGTWNLKYSPIVRQMTTSGTVNSLFGTKVKGLLDFKRVAISAPTSADGTILNAGKIFIYSDSGSSWVLLASINGTATNERLGFSCISFTPEHLAFGNLSGSLKVFNSENFEQVGQTLQGDATGDNFGGSVALSNVGKRMIVSAPRFDGNKGSVKVYRFNDQPDYINPPQVLNIPFDLGPQNVGEYVKSLFEQIDPNDPESASSLRENIILSIRNTFLDAVASAEKTPESVAAYIKAVVDSGINEITIPFDKYNNFLNTLKITSAANNLPKASPSIPTKIYFPNFDANKTATLNIQSFKTSLNLVEIPVGYTIVFTDGGANSKTFLRSSEVSFTEQPSGTIVSVDSIITVGNIKFRIFGIGSMATSPLDETEEEVITPPPPFHWRRRKSRSLHFKVLVLLCHMLLLLTIAFLIMFLLMR